jgi:hypothetical protein
VPAFFCAEATRRARDLFRLGQPDRHVRRGADLGVTSHMGPRRWVRNLDPFRHGQASRVSGRLGCASAKRRGGGGQPPRARAGRSRRRRRRPGGLSKAARNRLRSTQGNRRRQGHDGACDTLLIRRSSEFIKIFGTSSSKPAIRGACAPAKRIRSATGHLQTRGR